MHDIGLPVLLIVASTMGCTTPPQPSAGPGQTVFSTTGTILMQSADVIDVRDAGITVRFTNGEMRDYRTSDYALEPGVLLRAGEQVQVVTNNRDVRITR